LVDRKEIERGPNEQKSTMSSSRKVEVIRRDEASEAIRRAHKSGTGGALAMFDDGICDHPEIRRPPD
jgi:hypothetical protein